MNLEQWKALVRECYPDALYKSSEPSTETRRMTGVQFTVDDGTGNTYANHVGDVTAHAGPDMQVDVVGTYSFRDHDNMWQIFGVPTE